jgi:hypothetical protein
MSNTDTKKPGTRMKVANPPNQNGNGAEWENFGNLMALPLRTTHLRQSADNTVAIVVVLGNRSGEKSQI